MEINQAIQIVMDYMPRVISSDVSEALHTLIMDYYDLKKEIRMLKESKEYRR